MHATILCHSICSESHLGFLRDPFTLRPQKISFERSEEKMKRTSDMRGDQKPFTRIIHTLHLFSLGWSRCLACSIHKPLATEYVCVLDALSRQNATEAYFRAWLYEGTGLSHAPGFSAPVNLAHFTQCRGDSQPPLCRETNRDRRIQPHHKKTLFP